MLPAIIVVVKLAGYAITAYEIYRTASNAYGEVKNYQDNIKKAKEEIKKIMKKIKTFFTQHMGNDRNLRISI